MAGSHVQAAWSGEISVVGKADRVLELVMVEKVTSVP